METDLMVKLKEKLNSNKDEDELYDDLVAAKLESLSKLNKLKAKQEIYKIMFKFQLQQDEESNLPQNSQTENQCGSEFIRTLPPTPQTIVESSSPVYNLQHQLADLNLLDISSFLNLQPRSNQ